MGFRYRKSIKLGKGVRLNISKNSIGLSAGVKGARVSVNSKGRKTTTLSIPGTGISYSKTSSIASRERGPSTPQDSCKDSEIYQPIVASSDDIPAEGYHTKQTKHSGIGWLLRITGVILMLLSLILMIASPVWALGVLLGIAGIIYSGKQIGDDTLPLPTGSAPIEEETVNE